MLLAATLLIPRGVRAAIPTSQADINHLCAAWKDLGLEPTADRVELTGAIASYESGFGRGWGKSGSESNNWGAIHTTLPTCADGRRAARCPGSAPPSCPRGTFLYEDSDSQGRYQACFAEYATPRNAALTFLKVLLQRQPCRQVDGALPVLAALDSGDTRVVAKALWATCYFTTHNGARDAEARIAEYADGLERHRSTRTCPAWIAPPAVSTQVRFELVPGPLLRAYDSSSVHAHILLRAVIESLISQRSPEYASQSDGGAPLQP